MKTNDITINEDEITLKEVFFKLGRAWKFLKGRFVIIMLAGALGGALGAIYAYLQPMKYSARLSFVLEESKGGGGGLASLAGQFGIDFGGSAGGGLFTGDNILIFLKSQALVRETLLTQYQQQPLTLADQYVSSYGLKEKWAKNEKIGSVVFYSERDTVLSRLKDSLLQRITENIIEKELFVSRPDKKASFIEVRTVFRDEQLAKTFCDRLVSVALDKYVSSKVKVKAGNVKMLQRRADSLESLLNARTYQAASSQQLLLDINPGIRSMTASPEIRTREKLTAQTIYGEVVKNLELAKTILSQETPAIEIVDGSSFPLKKEKPSKLKYLLISGIICAFLTTFFLLVRHWLRKSLSV